MNNFYTYVKKHFDNFNETIMHMQSYSVQCHAGKEKVNNILTTSIKYLSPRLQDKINKVKFWHRKYILHAHQQKVILNIFSSSKNIFQDNNIIYVLLFTLYYCSQVREQQDNAIDLKIDIVLSKHKKELSRRKGNIDEYNVNSGVTSFDSSLNEVKILIFRREEVAKVLIHELLHALQIDDKRHLANIDPISKYFGATSHLNINESFTEMYASLLNIALATLLQKKQVTVFERLVGKETQFLRKQAYKVLRCLGFRVQKGELINDKAYRETTNIISYYVLKYITFCSVNKFCLFLETTNYELVELVDYIAYLNKELENQKWQHFRLDNDRSLRMSSIDLVDILGGNNKAYKTFC